MKVEITKDQFKAMAERNTEDYTITKLSFLKDKIVYELELLANDELMVVTE